MKSLIFSIFSRPIRFLISTKREALKDASKIIVWNPRKCWIKMFSWMAMIVSRSLEFSKCFTIKAPITTRGFMFNAPVENCSTGAHKHRQFHPKEYWNQALPRLSLGKWWLNGNSKFWKINYRGLMYSFLDARFLNALVIFHALDKYKLFIFLLSDVGFSFFLAAPIYT